MNARLMIYSVEEVKVLRSALGLKELNINDRVDNFPAGLSSLSGLDRLLLELELETVEALVFRLEHIVQKWHDEEKASKDQMRLEVEKAAGSRLTDEATEFLDSLHRGSPGVKFELREEE